MPTTAAGTGDWLTEFCTSLLEQYSRVRGNPIPTYLESPYENVVKNVKDKVYLLAHANYTAKGLGTGYETETWLCWDGLFTSSGLPEMNRPRPDLCKWVLYTTVELEHILS